MGILLVYDFFLLDSENVKAIMLEVVQHKNNARVFGIVCEKLEYIHQEIFPVLKEFVRIHNIVLVFYNFPSSLRISFLLEDIPVRFGCAVIE